MGPCRDGRRFIWAIDSWSERRKQPVIRSDSFNLTGSERTWVLSRTAETDSLHLTCSGVKTTLMKVLTTPFQPVLGNKPVVDFYAHLSAALTWDG